MPERIRFHLDEHVDPIIAQALRQHGIEVSTTIEAGLRMASDAAQLAYTHQTGRVMVTHDADFLRLASEGADHSGIAYCQKSARSLGEIIRTLILIHEVLSPDEIVGRVEYL